MNVDAREFEDFSSGDLQINALPTKRPSRAWEAKQESTT